MGHLRRRTLAAAVGLFLLAVVVAACSEKEPPRPEAGEPMQAWVCEACGHTFQAPPAKGARECPKCHKAAAVQSFIYVCGKCGKEFEGFRLLDCSGLASPRDEKGKPVEPRTYLKKKGGQWVLDEEELGPLQCPHCGNADRSQLTLKKHTAPPP